MTPIEDMQDYRRVVVEKSNRVNTWGDVRRWTANIAVEAGTRAQKYLISNVEMYVVFKHLQNTSLAAALRYIGDGNALPIDAMAVIRMEVLDAIAREVKKRAS